MELKGAYPCDILSRVSSTLKVIDFVTRIPTPACWNNNVTRTEKRKCRRGEIRLVSTVYMETFDQSSRHSVNGDEPLCPRAIVACVIIRYCECTLLSQRTLRRIIECAPPIAKHVSVLTADTFWPSYNHIIPPAMHPTLLRYGQTAGDVPIREHDMRTCRFDYQCHHGHY